MPDSRPRSPLAIARALHAALEAGAHGEQLRDFFTADARTLEHPNLIKPSGATADLARMLEASKAGAGLLSRQTYELRSGIEHEDTAILRVVWTGVIARDLGKFRAGQMLKAYIAQFVQVRDGRIACIETYDCYEPF
jgi:ketosteroid isomerase-like protein